MAFLQWKKCLSDPKQLLKLTAVIICICVAMYQLSECFRKITHPPVSTHYSFDLNDTLSYPALTVCRNPPYKTGVFEKFGITSSDPKYPTAWRNFDYANFTIGEFFEEATFSSSEVMPFYGFDGFDSNMMVESIFLLTQGRCFTATPKNETTSWTSGGFFLYFRHTDTVKKVTEYGVSLSGFNVYIHDRRDVYTGNVENTDSLMDHIYVESGEEMRLNLKLHVYEQLPTSDHKCNNSHMYSQSKCKQNCLRQKITETIGCSTPWLINSNLRQCGSFAEMYGIVKAHTSLSESYSKHCDCPIPCHLRVYTPYIEYRKEVTMPNSHLSISFSSNLVTFMKEILGYDWNLFLSDLGGSLGFLLGLSVIGAIGALEHVVQTVMTKKNEKQTMRKENNNEKEQQNGAKELQIYLNDKKLIDEAVAKGQNNKRAEFRSDSNFYASQNDKENFIQNKY